MIFYSGIYEDDKGKMNTEKLEKELNIPQDTLVYYDPRTNIMFNIRRREKENVIIGGLSSWYEGALTALWRFSISEDYLSGCQIITRDSPILEIDNHGFHKVKGYDCITQPDPLVRNVFNNPEFVYLDETDELAKANRQRLEDEGFFTDIPDDIED